MDLNETVSQDHLNNIDKNFRNIINTLNSTLFPNVTSGLHAIENKFKDLNWKNAEIEKIFRNSMNTLKNISTTMDESKEIIFRKIN